MILTIFHIYRYAEQLGLSYDLFQLVNSGAAFTAAILLICYSVSCIRGRTYGAVRPSLFVSENCFSGSGIIIILIIAAQLNLG